MYLGLTRLGRGRENLLTTNGVLDTPVWITGKATVAVLIPVVIRDVVGLQEIVLGLVLSSARCLACFVWRVNDNSKC